MSLYLEERIEEQKEDPENDKITFLRSWIIEVPSPNEENEEGEENDDWRFRKTTATSYNFTTIEWRLRLKNDRLSIISFSCIFGWIANCKVSYTLFYDNDMRFELYSSITTQMIPNTDYHLFKSPEGFFQKLVDPDVKRKVAKLVIHLELILPIKVFNRPFDLPSHHLNKKHCDDYPEDIENDFKFVFLKISDYIIKCSDGSVPALKLDLYLTSYLMKKHLKKSKDVEFVVTDHLIDVVKPIIYFLHSHCFEMPKSYDLGFADRLLKAIDFFDPELESEIKLSTQLSLCKKFADEHINFYAVLRWLRISIQHRLRCLWNMICALIANKFYFKWEQTFPQNARNNQNPLLRDIFGPQGLDDAEIFENRVNNFFESIESAVSSSVFTNVILD